MFEARPAEAGDGAAGVVARVEALAREPAKRVWSFFKQHPLVGTLVVAGVALAAADALGGPEVALAVALGYAAWEVLRRGRPVDEALVEGEHLVQP